MRLTASLIIIAVLSLFFTGDTLGIAINKCPRYIELAKLIKSGTWDEIDKYKELVENLESGDKPAYWELINELLGCIKLRNRNVIEPPSDAEIEEYIELYLFNLVYFLKIDAADLGVGALPKK